MPNLNFQEMLCLAVLKFKTSNTPLKLFFISDWQNKEFALLEPRRLEIDFEFFALLKFCFWRLFQFT